VRDPGGESETHWAELRSRHGGVDEIPLPETVPGRLWLCGKRFIGPDPEAAMEYVGADGVVCLNESHELDRYPGYIEWLKSQPGERVVWRPIPDLHAPSGDSAVELFDELSRRLHSGRRLLVHCGGGIGRAGTIAAGLLITMGETPADAVRHVRAHRPLGGPEAGAQAELLDWLFARRSGENPVDVE
jgi:protein-tyrosine phosphatase